MKNIQNFISYKKGDVKLWNECKNPSFLRKVTYIRSDYVDAVAKFHIHGFEL